MRKVVITGAAGLVGQNLVARLKQRPDMAIVGIDKHPTNVALFRRIHPEVTIIEADLASDGDWTQAFEGADAALINHAQIGGLAWNQFDANNIRSTERVLDALHRHRVPYMVGISSSVVNSKADDFYTRSKTAQERLFVESGIPHIVLRPTLMFGWFDRKHLGWLRRFMDRSPLFPIPDRGQFIRQPLYVGDFAAVIISALEQNRTGVYDISGLEKIAYGKLIELIHDIVKPRARIVYVPYRMFWWMLRVYGAFSRNPPFTTAQLEALIIPETFPVIDWPGIFDVEPTPLRAALEQTFLDRTYGSLALEF